MKVKPTDLTRFRNSEHFQFHTEVKDLVTDETPAKLKIEALFTDYLAAYLNEDTSFQKISKSATTEQIEQADKARDHTFRGLVDTNKAAINHFDPEIVAAAKRLKVVFDTYGNLAAKTLNEETACIFNLLQDLSGDYAADMQKVGLSSWANKLDADNNALEDLVKSRNKEHAAKTKLKMLETRDEIDAIYAKIVERINAFVLIEGEEPYGAFVNKLNGFIDKYNNTIAQRRGVAKAKKEKENKKE